jgi:hypothetical protein
MEPTGQELLAQLKRGQISPEVVKLSSCKLNDDQASQLADILKINKTIKSIYLEGNSIKDGGAKALGEALKSNTTLEYMNISNNSITFDGAREIFRGLKINRSLRGVDFANNNLHSEDPNQRDIFVVFQFNKTLQYLNLSNDKLSPSTMLRICEGLVLNKSLQWLDVSGNNFDDSIADTLRDGALHIVLIFSILFVGVVGLGPLAGVGSPSRLLPKTYISPVISPWQYPSRHVFLCTHFYTRDIAVEHHRFYLPFFVLVLHLVWREHH